MSRNVRLQLDAAATEALKKAKPDTPELRLAMRCNPAGTLQALLRLSPL